MPAEKIKFYNLSIPERLDWLAAQAGLDAADLAALRAGLGADQADHMAENAIGVFGLPLGVAQNFVINGRAVLVPMVIEEPSVIAGASFMAKLARAGGGFTANASAPEMIGQMQIIDLDDPYTARLKLLEQRERLLAEADEIDPLLKKLGGGPRDVQVRVIEDSPIGAFLVLHLIYDVRDAMGANAVNTAMERLTPSVEIMNGVDAVVIATGNDWRAIEAGAHAYAARSGRYTSLSTWAKDRDGNLLGTLEMPMAVGSVGGATRVHPAARVLLKLMGVQSAAQLAEIIVSVGLAQNLAALRALATEGIQRGHMGLHARQVAIAAGAAGDEINRLADQLVSEKAVRIDRAEEILKDWHKSFHHGDTESTEKSF